MAKKQINKINVNNNQNTSTNMISFEALENSNNALAGSDLDKSQSAIANKVNELIDWQSIAEDREIIVPKGSGLTISTTANTISIGLDKTSADYLGFIDDTTNIFKDGDWQVGQSSPNFPLTFNIAQRDGSVITLDLANLFAGQYFTLMSAGPLYNGGSTWTRTSQTFAEGNTIFIINQDTTSGFVKETEFDAKMNDVDKSLSDISEFSLDAGNRLVNIENELDNNVLKVDGTRIARTQDIYSQQQVDMITQPIDDKATGNRTLIDKNTSDISSLKTTTNNQATSINTLTNSTTLNRQDIDAMKPKVEKNIADIAGLDTRVGNNETDIKTNSTAITKNVIDIAANKAAIKTNTDAIGTDTTDGKILSRIKKMEYALQKGANIVTSVIKYASNHGTVQQPGGTTTKAVFDLSKLQYPNNCNADPSNPTVETCPICSPTDPTCNKDTSQPVFNFGDENILTIKIRFTTGNPASPNRNMILNLNTGDAEPTIFAFNDRAGGAPKDGVILKAQLTTAGLLTIETLNIDGTDPGFSVINFPSMTVNQVQEFTISLSSSFITQSELTTTNQDIAKNVSDIATLTATVGTKADSITVTANKQEFDNYKTSNDAAVAAAQTNANSRVLQTDYNTKMSALDNSIQANATAIGNKVAQTDYDIKMSALDSQISALAKKLTPAVTGVGEELLKELETKLGI